MKYEQLTKEKLDSWYKDKLEKKVEPIHDYNDDCHCPKCRNARQISESDWYDRQGRV